MRFLGISVTDLVAGLLIATIGLVVLISSWPLHMGTARSMGPGFVPIWLGIILVLLAAGIIFIEGLRGPAHVATIPAVRPLIFIPAAVIVFALTIQRFGLLPSVFATAFISTLADPASKVWRSAFIAVVLAVMSYLVFGYGLGLQVRAWRW